jgi:hypothetical protein
MKTNQVVSFFKGFKCSKNYLLMNYKLNKILNQTSKSKADLSHTTVGDTSSTLKLSA